MNKIILVAFLAMFTIKSLTVHSQPTLSKTPDTLRYKNLDNSTDTFFCIKYYINETTFIKQNLNGHKHGSRMTSRIDTFIISDNKWFKIFNKDTMSFLLLSGFTKGEKTNEYFIRSQRDQFYYTYIPAKKIKSGNLDFYLYEVIPMSGKGMDESLGEGPFHIIFNFQYGEIYRTGFHEKRILEGFEKYVKDFKW